MIAGGSHRFGLAVFRRRLSCRRALGLGLALLGILNASLFAQHSFVSGGEYDPAVPTPRAVLGYEVGDRFTPHHMIARYLERLAATSRRVRLDTAAVTFEGRELIRLVVTSEANQARLAEILRDAERIANPLGVPPPDLELAIRRLPAIVFLGYTVHGNEASGTEAALALAYQLAAGRDPDTQRILDSAVIVMDPVQNPDGHERHVQDVARMRGASGIPLASGAMIHGGTWPGARTSHYYFDLNRDWFILSHPESRGRVATFRKYWPHVAVDLHEMGPNSTYFFAPPMDPVNKNVTTNIQHWWDIFAAANAAAFDRHGWPYFRREGYDEFYPGYGVSWPVLTGAIGMTFEEASSAGGAIRRSDGTVLTLHDAAWHHYSAAWATLLTSAGRARERVRDYAAFRASAIAEGQRAPMRAMAFERDPAGRADSLVSLLTGNGIVVRRLTTAWTALGAIEYGERVAQPAALAAGTYVVDFAQPQGRLAKALLEPDAVLDSAFIAAELERRRTGQPSHFYDITAWALPYAFRVRAYALATWPSASEPVTWLVSSPSNFRRASFGYAFPPGTEPSLRMLAGLLAEGVRVRAVTKGFGVGDARFPRGAFLVVVSANDTSVHDIVNKEATKSGAPITPLHTALVDEGADLGSNSVVPIRAPRVGLLGGAGVSGNSFGFAWFALDQRLHYPVTTVDAAIVTSLLPDLDVLVVPSAQPPALDRALGESGRDRIAAWVRQGGVLVTLEGASAWLATDRLGLVRLRARQDSLRPDSSAGAALPAEVPGSIARVSVDTLSPLLIGMDGREFPVMVSGSRIYKVPTNVRPGEAVVRFVAEPRLRLAGYFWPEVLPRLAESAYLWTERVDRGRVIAFAGDPNFRDLWRGLYPLFVNAVLLGGSF